MQRPLDEIDRALVADLERGVERSAKLLQQQSFEFAITHTEAKTRGVRRPRWPFDANREGALTGVENRRLHRQKLKNAAVPITGGIEPN